MSASQGELSLISVEKGNVKLVWTCAEEGEWINWQKDVENGATKRQEKRKTSEKILRCSEGGRAEGWWTEKDSSDRV